MEAKRTYIGLGGTGFCSLHMLRETANLLVHGVRITCLFLLVFAALRRWKQSGRPGRDCSRAVPEILCGNIQNRHRSGRSILYKSMGVIIDNMNKIKKDVA
jgi:hypothetical protein